MRFQRVRAQAFGSLKDWESPPLNPGVIIICGRNESGKSTLFNLITTLFYGWYPANRDLNPYVPWGGIEAACEGELLIQGRVVTINRRLRSTPMGLLQDMENTTDLRNRAMPYVENVPRDVFREVYAIELNNLKFPEPSAWESIQQQLLGGQYYSFIRPVSQVVRQLEDEANRMWRPDRRGKPKAKEIQERLRELRILLNEARAYQERLHHAQCQLLERQQVLEKNIAKKAQLIAYIDRCERLNPVRKRLERIEELKKVSAFVAGYNDLPVDITQHLEHIDEQLEALKLQRTRLEAKKTRLEVIVSTYSKQDEALLSRSGDIKLLVKSYDRIKADQYELNNREIDIRSWKQQLGQQAAGLLSGGWKEELAEAVKAVDTAALKASIELFRQSHEQYQEQLNRVEALKIRLGQKSGIKYVPWASIALSVIGALGFIMAGVSALGFVSALVMVAGVVLLLAWWLFGGRTAGYGGLELEERRLSQLRDKVDKVRKQIKNLLNGLSLAPQRLEYPDSSVLVDVGKLKDLLERIQNGCQRRDGLVERINRHRDAVYSLRKQFEQPRGDGDNGHGSNLGLSHYGALDTFNKDELHRDISNNLEDDSHDSTLNDIGDYLCNGTPDKVGCAWEGEPKSRDVPYINPRYVHPGRFDGFSSRGILDAIDAFEVALQEAEKRFQDAQAAKSQLDEVQFELSRIDNAISKLEEEKRHIYQRLKTLSTEGMGTKKAENINAGVDDINDISTDNGISKYYADNDTAKYCVDEGVNSDGGTYAKEDTDGINSKISVLMRGRELARKADNMLEDLKREYPDLEDIRREIKDLAAKNEEWTFDDAKLALAKAERDQIEQELNVLNNEIGTLKKEIELGMDNARMDEIEGEISVLEEELRDIARQRDRILVLRNLILEAERYFREEHQPDVLKKAGKYLSIITDGKYTRLFTREGEQAGLLVKCGNSGDLIEVGDGFLSRGTLEQIYLSLRIALIEHLDPGGNPLPVFLDEVFVNWDGFRLDNGIGLLKEMATQRQVFIFTCHDWLVERLVGKLDVQVVELGM